MVQAIETAPDRLVMTPNHPEMPRPMIGVFRFG
jgi:hypothetical protein